MTITPLNNGAANLSGANPLTLAGIVLIALPMFGDYYTPDLVSGSPRTAILGNGLLLVAAMATAGPIVHMRKHRWRGSPFDLAP